MKISDADKNNEPTQMNPKKPTADKMQTNKKYKISEGIEVLENEILQNYPKVLEILLYDQTTQQNIFWATDNYKQLGEA
ncbi:MAG TPA: hypothetical protein PLD55_15670, partial [bacterium]|nr:hypothetical protein [bacterium]